MKYFHPRWHGWTAFWWGWSSSSSCATRSLQGGRTCQITLWGLAVHHSGAWLQSFLVLEAHFPHPVPRAADHSWVEMAQQHSCWALLCHPFGQPLLDSSCFPAVQPCYSPVPPWLDNTTSCKGGCKMLVTYLHCQQDVKRRLSESGLSPE